MQASEREQRWVEKESQGSQRHTVQATFQCSVTRIDVCMRAWKSRALGDGTEQTKHAMRGPCRVLEGGDEHEWRKGGSWGQSHSRQQGRGERDKRGRNRPALSIAGTGCIWSITASSTPGCCAPSSWTLPAPLAHAAEAGAAKRAGALIAASAVPCSTEDTLRTAPSIVPSGRVAKPRRSAAARPRDTRGPASAAGTRLVSSVATTPSTTMAPAGGQGPGGGQPGERGTGWPTEGDMLKRALAGCSRQAAGGAGCSRQLAACTCLACAPGECEIQTCMNQQCAHLWRCGA